LISLADMVFSGSRDNPEPDRRKDMEKAYCRVFCHQFGVVEY
jgi:hypothetical protein